MIPFPTAESAEAALGRAMTWAEAAWFRHSRSTPDYCLCLENFVIVFVIYTLAPLPLALLELRAPETLTTPYKIQPGVRLSPASFLRCYTGSARVLLLLTIGPLLLVPYLVLKVTGIRTGLPLPSAGEVVAQLLVYFLMEDYLGYWFHRYMHSKWAYNNIHCVHHEFKAPMGFVMGHSHWAELLTLVLAPFVVMVIVPCHITTCWLCFTITALLGVDAHCGFNFPFNPARLIPFYGGPEFHDYHHLGGKWGNRNFAPFFTFCDHIYGTDKGYRHYKASLAKMKNTANKTSQNEGFDVSKSQKLD